MGVKVVWVQKQDMGVKVVLAPKRSGHGWFWCKHTQDMGVRDVLAGKHSKHAVKVV